MMRDLEAPVPVYQGRGRRPKSPWESATQWRQGLDAEAWTYLTGRDGEKGPAAIEMVMCRVQTRIERKVRDLQSGWWSPVGPWRPSGHRSPRPRRMAPIRTPATAISIISRRRVCPR